MKSRENLELIKKKEKKTSSIIVLRPLASFLRQRSQYKKQQNLGPGILIDDFRYHFEPTPLFHVINGRVPYMILIYILKITIKELNVLLQVFIFRLMSAVWQTIRHSQHIRRNIQSVIVIQIFIVTNKTI